MTYQEAEGNGRDDTTRDNVRANITKANTPDVNTTSADRVYETAAVATLFLSSPPPTARISL